MYPFLEFVADEELKRFAESSSPFISASDIEKISRDGVERAIFSVFGYDLLYESKARRLLLMTLGTTSLRNLAKDLNINDEGGDFDIAMLVAMLPWRVGSDIVKKFLRFFKINDDFLPSKQLGNAPVEIVEPYSSLPPLFDYQEEMGGKITHLLNCPTSKMALIQLPTGAGKTRTILSSLIEFITQQKDNNNEITMLWLAHTEELCEQAIESFRRTWQSQGVYGKKIIRFWGSNKLNEDDIQDSFLVAGYQKITNLGKNETDKYKYLCNTIDIVVVDEAHKALAPKIKNIICEMKRNDHVKIIGLTATPGRGVFNVNENKLLAKLFDNKLLTVESLGKKPIETLQNRQILSKIKREVIRTDNNFALADRDVDEIYDLGDYSVSVLKRLAENHIRNELIVSKIFDFLGRGKQTLVFACSVEHARKLSLAVSIKSGEAATIDCTMRRNQRRKIINDFKDERIKVLFNYGVLSTGFDAPNIRAIVITRPTTSIVLYSQMIGRGLRGKKMGGSEECVLVDVVDNFINFGKADEVYEYFADFWK